MNSVDPVRRTAPIVVPQDDASSPATTRSASPPARSLDEVPAWPDANASLIARAAAAATATPKPLVAMAVEALDPPTTDAPTTVQRNLDAFRAAATPTYRVPREGSVSVAAPFRMPTSAPGATARVRDAADERYARTEALVAAHQPVLRAIAARVGVGDLYAVSIGHASPEDVRRLTQGLLDDGRLAPADGQASLADRVRSMMCEYGLGFDCAGYVQQAFLAARGLTRAQVGFAAGGSVERLDDLPAKGFAQVAPENAKPGDVVVLDPPRGREPGHRLVVYERRTVGPEDLPGLAARAKTPALVADRVSVLQVDSSFGSGGSPRYGGVARETWIYDATQNTWARDRGGPLLFDSRPYGKDSLRGIYHFPETR